MKKNPPLPVALPLIRVVREQRVILDADLARLYGVTTARLNQQFRRNRRRFPPDFAFSLTPKEAAGMMLQFATSSQKRNWRRSPIAYTEHGAVMAANVLKSARAVTMSVEVVRAFVQLRKIASSHGNIERILAELEAAVTARLDGHDKQIDAIFRLLGSLIQDDPQQSSGTRRIGSA
ncbi:MAG TPA: ORF6N domain-containing protein [Gemmatimonadaceae bacterium]|nr:ORF6N domain-containing protein [Gemmatimonadaceae bacterium]